MADERSCSECGARLRTGFATCPLCGAEPEANASAAPVDVEDYQTNVRKLRQELRKLRGEDLRAS